MNSLLQLISVDDHILVSKKLAKRLSLNGSIILGELITEYLYHESNNMLTEDDYFCCTVENLEQNVFLNEFFQRKAIKHLCEEGLITVEKREMPAKRYIHLNTDRIEEFIKSKSLVLSSKDSAEQYTSINNFCKSVYLYYVEVCYILSYKVEVITSFRHCIIL